MPKKYKFNPRKITKKEQELLLKDLEDLGDLGGIVHDLNTDDIVGGHQRLTVMFGVGENDVFKLSDADIEIVKRYSKPTKQGTVAEGFINWKGGRYAYRQVRYTKKQFQRANIVANLRKGQWDKEILDQGFDFTDLSEWGFDGSAALSMRQDASMLTTILSNEKHERMADMEKEYETHHAKAQALLKKVRIEYGDVFSVGRHVLICSDCLSVEVRTYLQKNNIDLILSDPPYRIGSYGSKGGISKNGVGLKNNEFFEDITDFDPRKFHEIYKNTSASNVFFCSKELIPDYIEISKSGEFQFDIHVWNKTNAIPFTNQSFKQDIEYIFLMYKSGRRFIQTNNQADYSKVYTSSIVYGRVHETEKPLQLIDKYVKILGGSGATVLDPYAGSGTTMIASELNQAKAICIEKDRGYCAVTLERMSDSFDGIQIKKIANLIKK